MNATFSMNPEFSGIEITFPDKPSPSVLDSLKNLGFRWHCVKKLWYAKESAARLAFAQSVAGETVPAPVESSSAAPAASSRLSLWERTRTDALPAYGTENAVKEAIRAACKANGWSYGRAAADHFRRHLKERFPEIKFSITSDRAGWLDDCRIRIKASPYSRERVKANPDAWDERDRWDHWEESPELAAVLNYAEKLFKAADADDGDYYADYGARHDLYGGAYISDDYQQTPPTDADMKEVEAFRAMKEEAEREEAEELERKWKEESARREIEAKEAAERAKIEAAKIAEIESAAVVVDLDETNGKAFLNLRAGFSKVHTVEELRPDEENRRENVVVSRTVTLSNPDHLAFFENHFLSDWAFLSGKGGTKTADVRINSADEWQSLNARQRETVSAYVVDAVAVYLGDEIKYVVDPEGFTYARYVFVPDAESKEIPAAEFERNETDASREKYPFYIPAPISEQIEKAGLKTGDPVSIINLDGMLVSVYVYTGKLLELVPCEYAQYKDAGKIDFIPTRKRNGRRLYFHTGGQTIIYKGTLPPVPDEIKYGDTADENLKIVRFAGMGTDSYLKEVLKYYESLGFSPVVDTFQR